LHARKSMDSRWESRNRWIQQQPNVMFFSTGQGMEADALIVSVHKDYADFAGFHQKVKVECGEHCEDFKTFIISLRGSVLMKGFTFNHLVNALQKD